MKRLLLLFTLMLCFCLHTQAKERTVTYKIKAGTSTATIICKGNFDKGILSDGPVKFYSRYFAFEGDQSTARCVVQDAVEIFPCY